MTISLMAVPPLNGTPLVEFMEPVADFIRYWFNRLFIVAVEAALFLGTIRALGGF